MLSILLLAAPIFLSGVFSGDIEEAEEYLQRYGYYQPNAYDGSGDLGSAIKEFQQFYQLNETGLLDKPTLELMRKPRCGYPDIVRRFGYYNTRGKWRSNKVTFKFVNYGDQRELSKTNKIRAVRRAFGLWAGVAPLTFREANSNERANINIGWHNGYHGDDNDFGRPWGVLAHAFFPLNGNTHFDEAERWVFENCNNGGVDMLELATHELGHALGLDHSNIRGTIMYPSYVKCRPGLQLHNDDIAGIRRLYGNGRGTVVGGETGTGGGGPDPPPTRQPPPPNGCTNRDDKCDFWAYNGYCRRSKPVDATHAKTMDEKCCLACKTKADCPNRNNQCDEWARNGECQKNPGYMNDWCRKACRQCSM